MNVVDNKNDKANIDISEAERLFTDFVADVCGKLPSMGIIPDGKIHRFSTKDDGTDRDGAYQYWPNGKSGDGRPHGWAQDHHGGGDMLTWQYNGAINQRTPEQMKAAREEAKQRQEEENRETIKKQEAAKDRYEKAAPARADNPYLVKKQVGVHGNIREEAAGGLLIIPFYDIASGKIIKIQTIAPDGEKKYDGRGLGNSAAAFYWGELNKFDFILLAEGYATGASVYEAMPDDIKARSVMFITGGCGRLLPVAMEIRKTSPNKHAKIIILADNDAKRENNPGLNRASEVVAKGYADRFIYPTFKAAEVGSGKNDWNDYATIYGAEAVRDKIMSELFPELFVESSTPDGLTIITPPAPAPAPEAEAPAKETPKKKKLISICTSLNEAEAEEMDMIGGLFPRGKYSMIFGEPGKGKTWIVLKTICDLSIGGEVLSGVGYTERPQRTLLYCGEAGKGMMNTRLKETGWRYDPEKIAVIDQREANQENIDIEIDKAAGQKALIDLFSSLKKEAEFIPDIFIIDSLSTFIGDETDRAAGRAVTAFLDKVANKMNCAVVVVHHPRKAKRTETGLPLTINDASGSGIFGRQAATIYAIEEKNVVRDGQEREEHIVRSVKSWYKKQKPFSYVLNSYTDEAGAERVSVDIYHDISIRKSEPKHIKVKEEILFNVFIDPDEVLTFADITERIQTTVSENTLRKALTDLVDEKRINRIGTTRDTRYALITK